MKDVPLNKKISPRGKAVIVLVGLFFIGIVVGILFAQVGIGEAKGILQDLGVRLTGVQDRQFSNIYTTVIVVLVIDLILLIGLLWIYLDTYRKTKSSFMLGLTLFISVLFIKGLLSLLIVHALFTKYLRAFPVIRELAGDSGIGSFSFLISIFEIIAISILLYISME